MFKNIASIFIILSVLPILSFSQTNDRYAYIDKFKNIAIAEMERTGVPASIKLAQGILESNAGKSTLARKANNHFGIKCGGDKWKGPKMYREDDDYDENGKLKKSCFRVYRNAESCFIAHSNFLRDNRRYERLFKLNPHDYKRWAKGLKTAGYATSPTYASKLTAVIEDYELYQFDRYDADDILKLEDGNIVAQIKGISLNNEVQLIVIEHAETVQDLALRTQVTAKKIIKYNEKLKNISQKIPAQTRVYLQPKRSGFRGQKKYHYIQAQESLFDLSQLYGVKLSSLQKRNRIKKGKEPKFGEKIKLRGFKVNKNKAVSTTNNVNLNKPFPTMPNNDSIVIPPIDQNQNPTEPKIEETYKPILSSDTGEINNNYHNPEPQNKPQENITQYHTVLANETLYSISRKYGVTISDIKVFNGLSSTQIKIGQRLRVK